METKEAIEFCKNAMYKEAEIDCEEDDLLFNDWIGKVISLLEQGEKHKRIVEDVEQYIIDRRTIEEDFATNGKDIIDLIRWLKRKYFLKLFKKTVIVDFESEDKDVVNSCINLLKRRLEEYSETIHINYKIKED